MRYRTERQAARALGLPNQGQLNKMRRGLIGETPAMRAAVILAKERARRAFLFVKPDTGDGHHEIDRAQLRLLLDQLARLIEP